MDQHLDIRRLPYMPLQIDRLRKSRAWLRCRRQPELGFYLMNLWMAAFHSVPAGSLEDDDDVLAAAAMCDPVTWAAVKNDVMYGWSKDGGDRVSHAVVTEIATVAATKLRQNKDRTEAAREALSKARSGAKSAGNDSGASATDIMTDAVTVAVTDPVTMSVTGHEYRSLNSNKDSLSGTSSDQTPKKPKRKISYTADFEAFWRTYPTTPNMSKLRASEAWGKLDDADRAVCLAAVPGYKAFLKSKPDLETKHAVGFINDRRFDGFAPTAPTSVDWTKRLLLGRTNKQWSTGEWGPAPGQRGCLVPSEFLQPDDGAGWHEWEAAHGRY